MLTPLLAAAALLGLHPELPRDDGLEVGVRLLRDAYPDARARGVRKLAQVGTPEAWARVRRALEDPEPQVADTAQRAMVGVRDPRVLAGWLGREGLRDRNAWVQLRVAQVAGAVELPVAAPDLTRALDPREVPLSRALCASLEDQARAGRLVGSLEGTRRALVSLRARARDPHLEADALAALVALDPAGVCLPSLLGGDEPLLRAAALRLAPEAEAIGLARRYLGDPDPRVRLASLERLLGAVDRATLEVLVGRLEQEPRLRLRQLVLAALRDSTGLRFGPDPRPWRRWLAGLPADWTRAAAPRAEATRPATAARPGRLPLESDRLCILVDLSGSLWAERQGGRSRKDLLDEALRDLLERLPPGAAFNLVPYASAPDPWRPRLVPATGAHVREALRTFERSRMTGKGNVWDALAVALGDPAVDTVLIISDGAPTGGRRWDLHLMAELIERERRWSGVAVSTVLVDASRRLQLRWEEVARRTGGSSVSVAFEGE